MHSAHSRKSLEGLKRGELQKLCKEYGVKANLKTEDLIDLLLDSQTPVAPMASIPRSTSTTRRSVSVKQRSQAETNPANPSRVSSLIVHELEEDDNRNEESGAMVSDEPLVQTTRTPALVPPPRTRKAKELQTRLGKGKPVIAGGSGPRAVTTSSASSNGRQAKSSKSMKPREPTIEEEPEMLSTAKDTSKQVAPETSQLSHEVDTSRITHIPKGVGDGQASKIPQLSSEIEVIQAQMSDISKVQKDILAEFSTLRELPALIGLLREDIRQLREGSRSSSRPSTPNPKVGQSKLTSVIPIPKNPNLTLTPAIQSNHSLTESTLGKRRRDSTSSIIDGVIEESQQDAIPQSKLAKSVIRPDKKRTKIHSDSMDSEESNQAGISCEGEPSDIKGPTFDVYRGSEGPDPAPPTSRLPEVFVDSAPDSRPILRPPGVVSTSSANATENQPFNLAFAPGSSNPRNSLFMANLPYPDLPQSPSPAGSNLPGLSTRDNDERTDIFKEFGLPSPVRPIRNYGALNTDERGINPAALQASSSKRVSSNEVAASLGLTAHRTISDPATEAPIIRRTMYGTELEGDTRFGDFGVEGVASGNFWPAK